jgi:leucyl aminopeptidase
MAAKSQKKFWGLSNVSLVEQHLETRPGAGRKTAHVFVHAGKKAAVPKAWRTEFKETASSASTVLRFAETQNGLKVLVSPLAATEGEVDPRLKTSAEARVRDAMGPLLGLFDRLEVEWAEIELDLSKELFGSALYGLEIALYRFKRVLNSEDPKFRLRLKTKGRPLTAKAIQTEVARGQGVNLARHMVNLPPNELNPVTYADFVQDFLKGLKNVKVDVWDEKKLAAENMNLHLAVGQASATKPRLVHIKYRPPGGGKAPIALIGKGITFDSGGLDIKPSSGMRLMKKDMGGSAAVVGVMYWAASTGLKVSLDAYLAMAENAVGSNSFRPSDVITARNGMAIEIHNTDAEGRLVLADAMDVGATAKEKPRYLIDVATLTGAIKVALGSQLAGLFSNDNRLSSSIGAAGVEIGDLSWTMPLFKRYNSQMNTIFADTVNSVDGFGGAVTAALFLEKFTREIPWAHLDIYAWKDGSDGAWTENGGSGQSVLNLSRWLEKERRSL